LLRVAAHYGISSIFARHPDKTRLYGYTVENEAFAKKEIGRFKLALGRVKIVPDLTWEERSISYAVLDLGDLNISGGVRIFSDVHEFARMQIEAIEAFQKGDITGVLQLMMKYFGRDTYSLWHLFKDEQRRILQEILAETIGTIEGSYREIYDHNSAVMDRLNASGYPVPAAFHLAAEYVANADLKKNLKNSDGDDEDLQELIARVKRFSFKVDKDGLRYAASQWLTSQMETFRTRQDNLSLMEKMARRLRRMADLNLELDLWKAQNIYFAVGKAHWQNKKGQAERGDEQAKKWMEAFRDLGSFLYVRIE